MAELLTLERERELIVKAQGGDRVAMNDILEANGGLVKKIAIKLCSETVEVDDLMQVGYMGLMRTVIKFDVDKKMKLSTYAYRFIHEYMVRHIQNYSRAIRIPVPKFRLNYGTMVQCAMLEQKLGCAPTPGELAEYTGKTIKQINKYNKEMQSTVSLNAIVPGNESDVQLLDIVPNEIEIGLHEKIATDEMLTFIKKTLKKNEYNVLMSRMNGATYDEIAVSIDLTKQRAQQIYNSGILKLKRNSKIKMFNVAY